MTSSPVFAAVISLLLATLAVAEIKFITISDDSRPVILLQKFVVTQTGHVTISVSSVSTSSQDWSRKGFYLVEQESVLQVDIELQQNSSFCVLDSHKVHHIDQSYQITSPGDYSLFFANCVQGTKVSMKCKAEMCKQRYLPAGSTLLPGLFFVCSLCYLTFFGLWVYLCYNKKQKIHILIAALLLMKSLSLLCNAEVKYYAKTTGTPHGWNISFHVFQVIGNVMLFMVIVLVGTGWSFVKPMLQKKEKKLLMMIIPFEVISTNALIVIGGTGPYVHNWLLWTYVFLFVEIAFWVAMRCVIDLWMFCVRKISRKAVTSPCFGNFYSLLFVYLRLTRVGVRALKKIVGYKYQWVSNAAEIVSLAFYALMWYYMFRPMERNGYFDVEKEEEEELLQNFALEEDRV
ncbi:unnamed protein product [Eruca vesicaria subsp. sativa]|uniref:Uncharacterized protein n=1 Tax=Eruca vesicaria subsp. sativa TaxID=29727 RepID=A0ABC8JCF5_ERUVS|nr:unnamed protein product [Eruca vesicaria subsp. sativa]